MEEKEVTVGKYLIKGKIAEGGMGAIYIARHPTLNRDIILKRLILRKSHTVTERFKREAELMIDFRDERIVQVYDFFKEGNSHYIAMEYVKGISLSDLIKKKKYIPNDVAILIFSEICRALKYAHDKGVIHRDIKPANILISNEGEVKLTDFGIARSDEGQGQEKEECLTADGMTLGTPAYMAPEQISDSKNVDRRADVYSMGVVLYEMVTGKCPFSGSFTPEAIAQIQRGEYVPPRTVNPKTAPVIKKIIKKAMHRKVKRRYKDLRYILAILKRYLRKYKDRSAVNQTIKEFLQGKADDASQKQGIAVKEILKRILDVAVLTVSTNFTRIITALILLALSLAGTGYYMYLKGMHYEYLLADRFGAFRVEIKTDKKYKSLDEKYIRLDLFRVSGGKFIQVKDPEIKIDRGRVKESRNYFSLETKKMYLPAGNYRLTAHIENELFEKDFNLEPRVLQRAGRDTIECAAVWINHKTAQRVPLSFYYSAADAVTKKDMTGEIELYIYNNKWYKWRDFVKLKRFEDIFTTGRTYRFQFFNDKYFTNFVRVSVSPFQSVLSIETEMAPLPGTLFYKSNVDGIKFLINNSDYYLSGTKSREYKKIEAASQKFKKLWLSPGIYIIKAEKSGSINEKMEVSIEPEKTLNIFINYDSAADKIGLEILN